MTYDIVQTTESGQTFITIADDLEAPHQVMHILNSLDLNDDTYLYLVYIFDESGELIDHPTADEWMEDNAVDIILSAWANLNL